jgi:transcriptional regulator with XRE-family HTH domain
MDDLRLGSVIRAVRIRRSLTQTDVAKMAGVSHATISLLERGHFERLSMATIRRVAATVDVRIDIVGRWRGGELDRLLSRRHSMLGESFAWFVLGHSGWSLEPEVSFSVYGERGAIDQLAWHPATAHLLVLELKTALVDINELLGTLDRKRRLACTIAAERGWRPALVSVWLIVEDTRTNRRHVADHRILLRARLPLDGRMLRSFLSRPTAPTSGLAFWPNSNPGSTMPSRRRLQGLDGRREMPSNRRSSVGPAPVGAERSS